MLLVTGAAFLVYQLRRYRADDYHGHYRLWRIAILAALFVSIDSSVGLAAALGGVIDIAIAEREVLAGADWVQLILGIGGAAFGLRMIGELGRQRWAAGLLAISLLLMALGPAVRWNFIRWDAREATLWVPIGLLAGRALLLVAVITYLRMLYREVRKMESGPGLVQHMRQWLPAIPRLRNREREDEVIVEEKRQPRKKVATREVKVETEETVKAKSTVKVKPPASEPEKPETPAHDSNSPTLKERLMGKLAGMLKRSAAAKETLAKEAEDDKQSSLKENGDRDVKQAALAKGKPVGVAEVAKANAAPSVAKPADTAAKPASPVPAAAKPASPVPAVAPSTSPSTSSGGAANDDDEEEEGGDDDVDWGGMNKAERRRMRKLMKRQGKAA
jgi:hypothetical protein